MGKEQGRLIGVESLPLFSGTVQTVQVEKFSPAKVPDVVQEDFMETGAGDPAPLLVYGPKDIDIKRATAAYHGTSWSPEKRGWRVVADYLTHMAGVMETYEPYATDENREQLAADLEAYRVGYLKKMYAYLDSHSRVMSTMITGPSNFPTRTNQKRSESADKRLNEWLDYNARGQKRLDKTYDPRMIARAARVIRSDEDDPISRLRAKLAKLEEIHEIQKAANKIVRSKKLSRDEKIAQLAEIDGISENTAQQLLSPDFAGRLGFPSYQLSNRSAEMRRIRQRIEGLEMEAARPDAEDVELENGVIIHENVELSRIQIIFPGIPAENIRAALKSRGFRWSRREGAWQRLLNNNARLAVQQLMSTINGGA